MFVTGVLGRHRHSLAAGYGPPSGGSSGVALTAGHGIHRLASMVAPRKPRRAPVLFRPRFTLMIVYFAMTFMGLALLLALPDLIAGALALPPGPEELSEAELARAREIAREAMRGKLVWAFLLALVTTGVLAWYRRLPGLRDPH